MNWHTRILSFSLALAILSLPLSMTACHASMIVFLLAWMWEGKWNEKARIIQHNPLLWAFIAFFVLHLIGVAYSEEVENAWFNIEKKAFLFLMPVALATSRLLERKITRQLFTVFIFTCFVTTILCLVAAWFGFQTSAQPHNFDPVTQALYNDFNPTAPRFWIYFSYIDLARGVGLHPTYLSLYLAFCLILLLHFHHREFPSYLPAKKIAVVALYVYFEVFIVLLSSRMVILATVGIVVFYCWLLRIGWKDSRYAVIAGCHVLFAVLLILINPITRYRSFQEPLTVETYSSSFGVFTYSTGIRKSLLYQSAQAVFHVNPIVGAGTGDVKSIVKKMSEEYAQQNIIGSYDPHNQYVYTYIGLGSLGLMTLCAFLFLPAVNAYHQKDHVYLSFIFLIGTVAITESIFESQQGIAFFALMNSLLVFQYDPIRIILPYPLQHG